MLVPTRPVLGTFSRPKETANEGAEAGGKQIGPSIGGPSAHARCLTTRPFPAPAPRQRSRTVSFLAPEGQEQMQPFAWDLTGELAHAR